MKKLCFILSLCTIFTLFPGCSSNQVEESENQSISLVNTEVTAPPKEVIAKQWNESSLFPGLEKVIKKGKLTVAMIKNDVDVFCETLEDGSLTGIDVQWAKDIANSLGVTLIVNRECDTYDKLTELLISGNVDLVISTYSLTTNRSAYVNISKPYLTSRLGVMLNKQALIRNQIENNPIDYMKDNTIKIAALRSSSHVKVIPEMFPKAEIIEMDTYEEICRAVRNNDVFGYLCGEVEFLLDYSRDPELSLYTKVFVFSDALEKYCIAVSPDNSDLLQFVNSCIDSSKTTTIKDVEEKCKETFSTQKE